MQTERPQTRAAPDGRGARVEIDAPTLVRTAPAQAMPPADSRDGTAPIVELTGVSKAFGATRVVEDVSLAVTRGQIYGLIGPSGCGKTTLVRMLVGVLAPSDGTISVMGVEPAQFTTRHRERIGYTPQGFYLYPTLTVHENARFVATIYGVSWRRRGRRIKETLQFLEIWEARKRLARDISGGMQRRLSLACALMHDPVLVFVDEPTAGLDPVLREKIWGHLRSLCDRGTTIFVTTQYIDEAAYCDTVAIMTKGRLAAVGTPEELRDQAVGGEALNVEAEGVDRRDIATLWQLDCVQSVQQTGPNEIRLMVDNAATATPAITEALSAGRARVVAVHPHVPSFDEVFMKIVGDHD